MKTIQLDVPIISSKILEKYLLSQGWVSGDEEENSYREYQLGDRSVIICNDDEAPYLSRLLLTIDLIARMTNKTKYQIYKEMDEFNV